MLIDVLNLICYSLEFVTCLILGHFRSFFWRCAPILGQRIEGVGGWGGRWQQLLKNCPEKLHSEDTDTGAVHLVSGEAQ